MAAAPGVLCENLAHGQAQRLAALLRLFGLRVRVECEAFPEAEAEEPRFDLSIRAEGSQPALAAILGLAAEEIDLGLQRPGGLVLTGLDWPEVRAMRAALADRPGLHLAVCDPDRAIHDLVPWERPTRRGQAEALIAQARRLGHGPCRLTGAVAAGLDRATRDHLMRRWPGSGLIAVNRDFQRFDLCLTGEDGRPAIASVGRSEALRLKAAYETLGHAVSLRPVWARQLRAA